VKTEDLANYMKKDNTTFTGTATFYTLLIANSGTTILDESGGPNSGALHFDNIGGYNAFYINNTPYFYVTADSCYVNNTLGIDTNEKQILFYRANNFWYLMLMTMVLNYKSKQELYLKIGMKMRLNFIKMVILKFLVHVHQMVFIKHQHYIKVVQQHFEVI
jgi:hypothetical protein